MNRDDRAPPPPPPMPPRQVMAPPAHRLLPLTLPPTSAPTIADVAGEPSPPSYAIIASHGEDADTSWADAMREELSCPICMDESTGR